MRDTALPETFNFPYDEGHVIKGILLPQTPLNSAYIPWGGRQLMVEDLEDVQAGRKFLYAWGWAKYNDALRGTPQHITKFCWGYYSRREPKNVCPTFR